MTTIKIAFWNLQNLFDIDKSPIASDFEFTPEHGWTKEVQEAKIANLARVINAMFDGQGPDLLGICEVENQLVAEQLRTKFDRDDLVLAHVESNDIRGIDCSLFYSQELFELTDDLPEGHLVHLRYPTRDIFEVPVRVRDNGAELVLFVNHWPSRRLGTLESEPYRITVANRCGSLVDSHLKLTRAEYLALPDTEATLIEINNRWNRNVLIMGDFNDEPYNRSVLEELQASKGTDRIEEPLKAGRGRETPAPKTYFTKRSTLFNCTWPVAAQPDAGTLHYSGSINTMNMLDQIIVSRGMYYGLSGLKMTREMRNDIELDTVAVEIFSPDFAVTSSPKRRPKPFEFSIDEDTGSAKHNNGFSDHFPLLSTMEVL